MFHEDEFLNVYKNTKKYKRMIKQKRIALCMTYIFIALWFSVFIVSAFKVAGLL